MINALDYWSIYLSEIYLIFIYIYRKWVTVIANTKKGLVISTERMIFPRQKNINSWETISKQPNYTILLLKIKGPHLKSIRASEISPPIKEDIKMLSSITKRPLTLMKLTNLLLMAWEILMMLWKWIKRQLQPMIKH